VPLRWLQGTTSGVADIALVRVNTAIEDEKADLLEPASRGRSDSEFLATSKSCYPAVVKPDVIGKPVGGCVMARLSRKPGGGG